jgi:hypothetical protein
MFPVDRLQLTVSEMMIDGSEFLESTVSTRRHDTFGPDETKMGVLATITVHRLRDKISFATTVVMTLSLAPSSFTALKTFDSDLGSVHRLGVRFAFPFSPRIGESSLLGGVFLVGVLKPTGRPLCASSPLVRKTDL